jgi:LysR family transcriptional regulator, glycine cleavage system transcriptional activator
MFHATARAGSIAGAAQELGVTPSAITQQIQTLETYLGTSLLIKDGRKVKLTEEGERFYNMTYDGFEQIVAATHRLRGHRAVSVLTVRASPSLSSKWLLPRLARFIEAHPQLDVRIDGTNEPTNFEREDVDVEIRHGKGHWPGLFVDGFAMERFFPVCSPRYAPAGSIEPAELPRRRLIHSVKSLVSWTHWFEALGIVPDRRWDRVLFDRSHMVIDAAAAGLGIALESDLLAWEELRDGRLVCPVPSPPVMTAVTQWLACPHDHLRRSKVRAFIEWVGEERDAWLREVEPMRAADR